MVREGDYVAIFHSVHRVLKAEKVLKSAGMTFKLIPAPRSVSADCGLALCFDPDDRVMISEILDRAGVGSAELWLMQAGNYTQIL